MGKTSASDSPFIWGNLLHLSFDMWSDRPLTHWDKLPKRQVQNLCARPYLRFDESLWHDVTARMAEVGMNMVVIDLGDAVRYQSHPEIAVKGAWSPAKLKKELTRLRKLGLEPIPKLNFSTAHDAWLGPYARCVSTPTYYRVCADLITEVVKLFDHPRFFHLGYDEEDFGNQQHYSLVVIRQHELWWHDFAFFAEQVEKQGVRPWIWADYSWHHPEVFYKRMPRSVLQSNWWYWPDFNTRKLAAVRAFGELDRHHYEQIPTASNWVERENFAKIVEFCRRRIHPSRLLGFLQTVWLPTVEPNRTRHFQAVDAVGKVIEMEAVHRQNESRLHFGESRTLSKRQEKS